jgi:hypothetical protein
VCLEDINIV